MNILVTSGGTIVPIDSVRYIANMATGKFGLKIAAHFQQLGHNVFVLHSRNGVEPSFVCPQIFQNSVINYSTYWEYHDKLQELLKQKKWDIVVSAAAVSDYEVVGDTKGKISGSDEITITLKPVPKVLPFVKKILPQAKLIGFKLLVGASQEQADQAVQKQFNESGSDIVAYNDLNSRVRKYTLISKSGNKLEIGGKNLVRDFVASSMDMLFAQEKVSS